MPMMTAVMAAVFAPLPAQVVTDVDEWSYEKATVIGFQVGTLDMLQQVGVCCPPGGLRFAVGGAGVVQLLQSLQSLLIMNALPSHYATFL